MPLRRVLEREVDDRIFENNVKKIVKHKKQSFFNFDTDRKYIL